MINQPIDKVFKFVTTPENDAQWYIGVESRDHTPGEPAGVGSTSLSTIRFLGVPMTVEWEVIGYDAPTKIDVKTTKGPVSVESGYVFESLGANQTKVSVYGTAAIAGASTGSSKTWHCPKTPASTSMRRHGWTRRWPQRVMTR